VAHGSCSDPSQSIFRFFGPLPWPVGSEGSSRTSQSVGLRRRLSVAAMAPTQPQPRRSGRDCRDPAPWMATPAPRPWDWIPPVRGGTKACAWNRGPEVRSHGRSAPTGGPLPREVRSHRRSAPTGGRLLQEGPLPMGLGVSWCVWEPRSRRGDRQRGLGALRRARVVRKRACSGFGEDLAWAGAPAASDRAVPAPVHGDPTCRQSVFPGEWAEADRLTSRRPCVSRALARALARVLVMQSSSWSFGARQNPAVCLAAQMREG
jgi:hypothetical protein